MQRTESLHRTAFATIITCLLALTAGAASAGEELTLRVNDAQATPGGIVALVVRTYESRPLGQGQFCFRGNSFLAEASELLGDPMPAAGNPFDKYLGSIVFSSQSDAVHRITLEPGSDVQFLLEFMSPSATINDSDGPLVVHYLRLRSDLLPGERFLFSLDPADTWIIDDLGNSLPIEIREGELSVRSPAAPILVGADADEARPGGWAAVAFETIEAVGMSSGEVTLVYDAAIASGDPLVVIDPKLGGADFVVDNSTPGRAVVDFNSPGATLNRLPGEVIRFLIPTRSDVPLGTRSPVSFSPDSVVLDRQGNPLNLAFEAGIIEFVND